MIMRWLQPVMRPIKTRRYKMKSTRGNHSMTLSTNDPPKIKCGDVWWVCLDPTQGAEIKKTRPCIVLTHDTINEIRKTVVVVPFSSTAKSYPPITVTVVCQNQPVVAVIDQIRAVAKHRLQSRIETASKEDLQKITGAVSSILRLVV
jgi:mRNA interferase MazF